MHKLERERWRGGFSVSHRIISVSWFLRVDRGGRGEAELKTLSSSVYVPAVCVCLYEV